MSKTTIQQPASVNEAESKAGFAAPSGSASGLTLAGVVERIAQCGAKYKTDYGVEPFDVCLGPAEFQLIYREGRSANEQPPDWHYKLAPIFYEGMRVRLMNTPGVLVGTLTSKTPNEKLSV
jgi:hypothetical protein